MLRNIEGLFRQLCPALPRQKGLHIIRRVNHYRIRLGGIHNRQLGDGLGGIQRRGYGKGGERPIHQLGGFGQRRARVFVRFGTVQHHADIGFAVLGVPARKILPVIQAACFAAFGVRAVIVAAGRNQLITGQDGIGRIMLGGGRHLVAFLPCRLGKGIIAHSHPHQQVGIPRGGHIAGIQPAGVSKGSAGAADAGSFIVHHGHKVINAAAAHIVCHDIRCLVGAGQQHGIQQAAQGMGLVFPDIRRGSIFAVQVIIDIARRCNADGIQLVLVAFQHQDHGHQLGQAGGGHGGFAVFFINNQPRIGVSHIGCLCGNRKSRCQVGGIGGFLRCGGQDQQHRQQQYRKAGRQELFHGMSFLVCRPNL